MSTQQQTRVLSNLVQSAKKSDSVGQLLSNLTSLGKRAQIERSLSSPEFTKYLTRNNVNPDTLNKIAARRRIEVETSYGRPFTAERFSDYFASQKGLTTLTGSIVQFSGRASKGIGSAYEAVATLSKKLASLGGVAQGLGFAIGGVITPIAIFSSGIAVAELLVGKLITAFSTMYDIVSKLVAPGLDLMATMNSAQMSLSAGMRAVATLDGRQLTKQESDTYASMLANKALIDAQASAFNVQELITALQGTMPTLLNKGMDVQQAYDITKGVASVAKLTRLSANQVLQETRDIAQGTLSSRSSQVANTLGISNEDLSRFKGDVEGLYKYLMEKFMSYADEMKSYAETPTGAWERFSETLKIASMTLTENLAPAFAKLLNYISDNIGLVS